MKGTAIHSSRHFQQNKEALTVLTNKNYSTVLRTQQRFTLTSLSPSVIFSPRFSLVQGDLKKKPPKKHVVWLSLLTTSLHFLNFWRGSSPCWIKSGRLSPVRETLLLIFNLKPENKAEWYSSRSGVNWEEIHDNSDGESEALDASLCGSLLQKLYFPSIPVRPVCVTADPLGSRAGEKPERGILSE